jgi:hypothetical protein
MRVGPVPWAHVRTQADDRSGASRRMKKVLGGRRRLDGRDDVGSALGRGGLTYLSPSMAVSATIILMLGLGKRAAKPGATSTISTNRSDAADARGPSGIENGRWPTGHGRSARRPGMRMAGTSSGIPRPSVTTPGRSGEASPGEAVSTGRTRRSRRRPWCSGPTRWRC